MYNTPIWGVHERNEGRFTREPDPNALPQSGFLCRRGPAVLMPSPAQSSSLETWNAWRADTPETITAARRVAGGRLSASGCLAPAN